MDLLFVLLGIAGTTDMCHHVQMTLFIYLFIFEIRSHCVTQGGLELTILLPQPPEHWDYKHKPPHLALQYIPNHF
jgi:hypothetical protein